MGVFARRVVGLRFFVFVWVFALLVLARVCWGWWGSVVPPPLRAHCPLAVWAFGAHAPVWALLACAGCCVPDGRRAAR